MTLAEALGPLDIEAFLRDYLGERFVVVNGARRRFRHLVPWRTFNDVLSCMRADGAGVLLSKEGKPIPRSWYTRRSRSSGAGADGAGEYLSGPAMLEQIFAGAKLTVGRVDELFPEIRSLAESCEDIFHAEVSGELHVEWRATAGAHARSDPYDTLVIQVKGRHNWQVWKPTSFHPIESSERSSASSSSADLAWEGTLDDGDLLYLPRGWWHSNGACNGLDAYVVFRFKHVTGLDLLAWLLQQAKSSPKARMNVPHWKDASEQREWIRAMRGLWDAALTDDVIARYVEQLSSSAHGRPVVRIPDALASPTTVSVSVSDVTPLRLAIGRRLRPRPGRTIGTISFRAQNNDWICDERLSPAIKLLHHTTPCTLSDMSRALDDDDAKPLLRPFIDSLILANVVWAEPVPPAELDSE